MTVGEDSVQYKKRKKHCFLAAASLLLIGKLIITLMASLSLLEALFLDVTSDVLKKIINHFKIKRNLIHTKEKL